MKFNRFAKFSLSLVVLTTTAVAQAIAQCAMCKANIAGAENSAEVSRTINTGVLALLVPTLVVIGGIAKLIFKYRHSSNGASSSSINPDVNFRPPDTQRDSQ